MYHFDLYTSRAFTISKEMRKQTISNRRQVITNKNAGIAAPAKIYKCVAG